ncbi:MAG TPA: hypothetical protein VL053_17370, partial [Arachidicoccus sp.]|nr:hypothetical protein [Arachidicoccus sp.]
TVKSAVTRGWKSQFSRYLFSNFPSPVVIICLPLVVIEGGIITSNPESEFIYKHRPLFTR